MTDLVTIDLDHERMTAAKLYVEWQKALAEKRAIVEYAAENKVSPGNNYWLKEATARARWIAASNFVEVLEQTKVAR